MTTLKCALRACSTAALTLCATVTAQACAIAVTPLTTTVNAEGLPAAQVFQTSVTPQSDEDLAAPCRYEITLMTPSRTVQAERKPTNRPGGATRAAGMTLNVRSS